VEATKNAARLSVPIFVILPGQTDRTRRVRLGWVEDWDDKAALFLVLFGDAAPTYVPPVDEDAPFSLTDDAPTRRTTVKVRVRQQVFRFQVLAQYGSKCAVCSISHPSFHPDTLSIVTDPRISPTTIGLGSSVLAVMHKRPHADALAWRFKQSQSKWGARPTVEASEQAAIERMGQ
jgi:hypothetical protein